MKLSTPKRLLIGLSTVALAGILPFTSEPVRAQLTEITESIASVVQQPEVKLFLAAEKQLIETKPNGEEKVSWEALENKATVHPGDILRYTVAGHNAGAAAASGLNIAQPIPSQMTYLLDSANSSSPAAITYSIDGGETFVLEPMVEVTLPDGTVELQPAPADLYTHLNWSFDGALSTEAKVNVSYEAVVK